MHQWEVCIVRYTFTNNRVKEIVSKPHKIEKKELETEFEVGIHKTSEDNLKKLSLWLRACWKCQFKALGDSCPDRSPLQCNLVQESCNFADTSSYQLNQNASDCSGFDH